MRNGRRIHYKIIIGAFIAAFAAIGVFMSAKPADTVSYADTREKNFTAAQSSVLTYCGENYLTDDTYKNALLSAISFELDDEKITVNALNAQISGVSVLKNPGIYSLNFAVNYEDVQYTAFNVAIVISKRKVTVETLLNGQNNLTVREGETVGAACNYVGAVESDTEKESVGSKVITVLKDTAYTRPAFVEAIPTSVVTDYTIVADHAASDYYDFVYTAAYLTITENTVPELEEYDGSALSVSVIGTFSVTYDLYFNNIGVSKSSSDYAAVSAKLDTLYGSGTLLDEYDVVGCYDIDVKKDGNLPNDSIPSAVKVKIDSEMSGRSSYKVIALYNNGDTEVLDASVSDGYLSFYAADMGVFAVISPVESISLMNYAVVIGIGVLFVIIVILGVVFFRRKY